MLHWLLRNRPGIAIAIQGTYDGCRTAVHRAIRYVIPKRLRDSKSAQVVVAGAFSLTLVGVVSWHAFRPSHGSFTPWSKVWCYNMATGELFVGSETRVPPFAVGAKPLADGSPAGVRAEVYSCGSCDSDKERFPAFLWKFKPEVRERLQGFVDASPRGFLDANPYLEPGLWGDMDGKLLAAAADRNNWVADNSDEGAAIRGVLSTWCSPGEARPCPAK